ncbi:MAG: hypothetical protein IKM31_10880 [Oscillospiraceae bacterium]|nr:hypothetical protein [Oscillospiraceae bacterium]
MKKNKLLRILLPAAYCTPFAFLAVNGDAVSGTMLFYGVMIAGFSLLCWGSLKTDRPFLLCTGSVLSFVSSCAAAKLSGLEKMGHYFKPFTSYSLIAGISAVVFVGHLIIMLVYRAKRRKAGR